MAGGATALCQVVVIYTPQASRTSNASATLTVAEPGLDGSSATASLTGIAVSP
jgi:hypothetical protein